MNRNFIFVFFLLATLSMINAIPLQKRESKFLPCPVDPPPTPLTVSMTPDPPVSGKDVSFTITAKLDKDVDSKTIFGIGFADASGPLAQPTISPACDGEGEPKCPIKAGTEFTLKPTVQAPDNLPTTYGIVVIIGEPTDDPKVPLDAYGCAYTTIGGDPTAEAVYPIAEAVYPIAGSVTEAPDAYPTI
ncbi:hypothetical protein C1645_740887 [Glomus cerebriforme]|uniref:Phosphatidylglycerol/phosphatidylinositol transfer protein n=1 Tax=Glomus cerebriforme TaxID=658196 RepID=A0A397SUJ1_9GLOM|nr:hypothetical protein C1645_740887 [Glomus cerebriforme]